MLAARGRPRMRLTIEMAERAAVWSRKSIAKECSVAAADPPVVVFSEVILLLALPSASD